jgi:hypothetical protein
MFLQVKLNDPRKRQPIRKVHKKEEKPSKVA